jgi:hypothetical protein
MTGHPSNKTHLARGVAAAKAPESSGNAALRLLSTVSRGLRVLFQHK